MTVGKAFNMLLRILRDGLGALITLAIAAIVFVLFTETGARLAFREVTSRLDMIQVDGVGGRLWGPLSVEQLRYEDDLVRVDVEGARLDWSVLQALLLNVTLSELSATSVRMALKPQPEKPEEPEDPDAGMITQLPVNVDVRDLRVGRFELQLAEGEPIVIDGIAFAGAWAGDRIRVPRLAAITPWVGAVQLDADLQLHPDALDIEALTIAGFIDATAQGRFGYTTTPSDIGIEWTSLRWPPERAPAASTDSDDVQQDEARETSTDVDAAASAEPPADASIVTSDGGRLRWQGVLDDWGFEIDGGVAVAGETLKLDAQGRGSLEQIVAERLRVDTGHGRVDTAATVKLGEPITIDAKGRVDGLKPEHWVPDLQGLIQGSFTVTASLAGDSPTVQFDVKLDRSQLQGYAADLIAQGRYEGDRLQLSRMDLRSGSNRLQASGRVLPDLAVDATLDGRNLSELLPALSGRLNAKVKLSGPLTQPRVAGEIKGEQLRYETFTGDAVSTVFDLDLDGPLKLDAQLRGLSVGTPIEEARISLRGRVKEHRLSLDVTIPQGAAQLAVEGALDLERTAWKGTIAESRLAPEGFPAFVLEEPAALSVVGDAVELEPACFAGSVARLCAALRPVEKVRRAAFRLDTFDLAVLAPWLPPGLSADGRLDGRGYVDIGNDGLQDLRLSLNSSAITVERAGLPPLVVQPGFVRVDEEERVMQIEASLPFERGGVQLDARLDPHADFMQRNLSGELKVDLPDLAWLHVFNRELQEVQGRLDGRITMAGTPAVPRFDGAIELADAGLRLRSPGIKLEQMRASVRGGSEGALTIDAEVFSDNGPLRVAGQLDPWSQPLSLDLTISGDKFQAVRIPDASIWISPQLGVKLAGTELRVTGTVDVPRADITPKTIDSGIGPSGDQVIVRYGDSEKTDEAIGIFADVQLRLGDAVQIDGFGLTSRITGAVRVTEQPGVPTRARGELQLLDGRYKAYGQDLTLETGKLLFTGGALTDPAVELRATRKPREDITVGVLVRGTLDKPEFSLFSTPTMPQERQLSWLVLGRSLDEGGSASERGLVADAALGLGLAGGDWLAQRLGGSIGFDEISLGAKPGESSDQAKLTVGKYLSPKLFISYGVGLFQPGHTFRLQYDIGRGFKLATETGIESGGDLLYTIER